MIKVKTSYNLVHLLITNRCNLHCVHCLANSGNADDGELTTREMIRTIEELNKISYKDIHFEGGEPFLHKDFDEILDAFTTLKNATIITNGTIPWDKRFEVLLRKKVDSVMFSIDNFGRPKDAQYPHTLANLSVYKKNGVAVKIRTTINHHNLDFMEVVIKEAIKLGISSVRFGAYKSIGRGGLKEMKDAFALKPSDYRKLFTRTKKLIDIYGHKVVIKLSTPASFTHTNDGYKVWQIACNSPIADYALLVPCFAFSKQFNIYSNGIVTACNESCTQGILGNVRVQSLKEILSKEDIFKNTHGCGHGHLLISSDKKSFNMQ